MKSVLKKDKGFTLVELLGIIVILAIIALITVPIMRKVILESEKGTFLQTGREIFKAGENYKTVERVKGHRLNGCAYFDFGASIEEETIIRDKKYIPLKELNLQGKFPIEGILKVCEDKIELEVGNGHLVARGDDPTTIVVEEGTIADTDKTPAIIELINLESTTSTIKVTVNAYEEQGEIEKYLYSIDGTNYTESKNNTYTFENLTSNKEYKIYVKVVNKSGLETKGEKTTTTKSIENPKITYTNIPNEVQNGYLKEQTVNIIFSSANISNPQYFIKTTRVGISSVGVTSSCGTETTPGDCSDITNTTTLSAGTWYKVSENINVTYNTESTETGTIYALTYDGTNYSAASTATISKIDRTSPSLSLGTITSTSSSITIPISMSDSHSGLGIPTCKYGETSGTYNRDANSVNTTSCLITGLTTGKTYYYEICVNDKVGNDATCKTGSTTTGTITKPTIAYINTPNEVQNGYLKEQTAQVTFSSENISNPEYFIKTTKVGTSSVGVTSSCGTGTTPGDCSNITSTTTLSADTWYKVSGNINVTYNTESTETGTIYSLTYDGTNYSTASTGAISKIDRTSPNVTLGTVTSTSNSIIIPITKMEDTKSGISTYTCKYGENSGTYNRDANSVNTTSCSITGLTAGKTYYYQVCVNDNVGNTATCKTGSTTTGTITKPTITYTSTPSEVQNGYLREQTINITFSSANISNPQYFIRTTKVGTSNIGVTSSCGTGTTPGDCSNISSTTTLAANTWYKVSGNINVTYNTESTETGTIYALTYDGTNYSAASTGSIAKIDRTSPTVALQTAVPSPNGIKIPYTMNDTESGIGTPTCKYGTTSGTYNMNGTATTSSCVLTGLTTGKTYYYEICVSDKVGNTATCKTGSEKVKLATPTITYTNTPSEPVDGWLKEQVVNVKFNGEGVSNPQYFIKTTQIGTSSIAVTESYGTGDMPGTKTTISSRTSLSANTWYKVSGDVNITYNRARTVEGTIYALMYDGTEYSDAATGTLAKIDRTTPTLSVSVSNPDGYTYATSHTATITISDSGGSGLSSTPVRIYYAWGTSSQSCSSMSKYVTITPSSGATSATVTISMSASTYGYGNGNIYICNKNAVINDKVGNSLAQSTLTSYYMYLGYKYSDGTVIYFNPTTGSKCANYTSSQSNTGVNSGCMKWYVVNDDYGSATVNLLLDHNISYVCNQKVDTISTVINQLRSDTSSWTGVITHPTTTGTKGSSGGCTCEGAGCTCDPESSYDSYTIPYNYSKARLPKENDFWRLFDEKSSSESFLRSNLSDKDGYWLSDAYIGFSFEAANGYQKVIYRNSSYVNISSSYSNRCNYIRPVIEVSKSKL